MAQFVNMSRCVLQEFETTEPPTTQPTHASQNGYMRINVSAQSCNHIYIYIKYLILSILLNVIYIYMLYIYIIYIYYIIQYI